jgi:membrane-associated HD superfamily phosphohydrolase
MKTTNYFSAKPGEVTFQWKATLIITACTLLLPFIFHLFPPIYNTPIGALFLPIFYAPFVALVFYRTHVGLLAGALAPLINHLVTGQPILHVASVLSFELVIFVLIAAFLLKTLNGYFITAPLAYLLTKVVSSISLTIIDWVPYNLSGTDFFVNSISNGIGGIIILGIINYFAIKIKSKDS